MKIEEEKLKNFCEEKREKAHPKKCQWKGDREDESDICLR